MSSLRSWKYPITFRHVIFYAASPVCPCSARSVQRDPVIFVAFQSVYFPSTAGRNPPHSPYKRRRNRRTPRDSIWYSDFDDRGWSGRDRLKSDSPFIASESRANPLHCHRPMHSWWEGRGGEGREGGGREGSGTDHSSHGQRKG